VKSFYLMTMPGLETLAFSELRAQVPDAELVKFARGIALFRTATEPGVLLDLRTVEDVFSTLVHVTGLGQRSEALRVLHSATLQADISTALTQWKHVHGGAFARTWRVVSQMTGTHAFRRVDAGQAVADALHKVLPRAMRQVGDDADVEVWLWIHGSEVLIGLRLSDATMRHRTYKREHLPASLRPTVAAAMAWLSQPTPDDIVLDPLCGAGTLLIERAMLGPYDRLIGGDIQGEAVAMAKRNARVAEVMASWRTWDARELPLPDGSVTRILTNLPFGKQLSTRAEIPALYKALLGSFERVLAPAGLLVTLTSEDRVWETLLHERSWKIARKVVCVILGQPASIFVAARA
jgi:tRNA (guanine6-N2)-methyltransferase